MSKIDKAFSSLEKRFGKGTIGYYNEIRDDEVGVIPTGNLKLDIALGVMGYPRGRIIEVFGPESSGKTTLALHALAEVQKQGEVGAIVDAEHAVDPVYATSIGVNIDELIISQPDYGEQALEVVDELVNTGEVALIVVDSVAALTPQAEIVGDMGDSHVGLQARLMSQALRKITAKADKTNTTVFFINQLREKIGVMFGSPETTPGGRALKFYSSVRLDVRRTGAAKKGTDIIGNKTKVKVSKNKVAPPFKQCEFDIIYGEGMQQEGILVDLAVDHELWRKSGAWYYDENGEQVGQGHSASAEYLKENPEVADELYNKIVEKVMEES